MSKEQSEVAVKLAHSEALVLFDLLARWDAGLSLPLPDAAEQQVLWKLEGQLEKTLVEPLEPDYAERLEKARKEVLDV